MADVILTTKQLITSLKNYNKTEIHIHHTWKPSHADFNGSNHFTLQENMRNYHVNTLGWSDIAQHVTLMPDGLFVTGRDFERSPASVTGFNHTGVFMVEMIGNFDIGHDVITDDQLESIVALTRTFDINRFHREMKAEKSCPGTGITREWFDKQLKFKTVEEIIAEVSAGAEDMWNVYLTMRNYVDELIVKAYYKN